VSRGYREHEKQLLEVGGQLPGLRKQIAGVQEELKRAQNELAQLPEIRKQLQQIERVVLPGITLRNDFIDRYKDRCTLAGNCRRKWRKRWEISAE
jgi:uncharacterized protein involved in exopolysaccharide biosynthesis